MNKSIEVDLEVQRLNVPMKLPSGSSDGYLPVSTKDSCISADVSCASFSKEECLPQKQEESAGNNEITSTGLKVLAMLAIQNCSKNLLTRYVLTDTPKFLYSAAVIGMELTKLVLSILYILVIERHSMESIVDFLKKDVDNMKLLLIPACVYNVQKVLELVALANIDASIFSVLVQSKLIMTALFSSILLGKSLGKLQKISLVVLTTGVILCNLKLSPAPMETQYTQNQLTGILATLGISLASGFAAVYTEKVIKKQRVRGVDKQQFSLAYMQVQLAIVSLVVMGAFALMYDWEQISTQGLWHNFSGSAFLLVLNSGIGGLMVAAVLKYADSVLKGYATALSVVLTGVLSWALFGTTLNIIYVMGIVNVITAVLLYN